MELPMDLRDTPETLALSSGISTKQLAESVRRMTTVYKEESGRGARLVTAKTDVLAYAVTRMPATFGAVSASLSGLLSALAQNDVDSLHTVLDLGAGTGSAVLAVSEMLPALSSVTAVEREGEMIRIGKTLTANTPGMTWVQTDVKTALKRYAENNTTFDLVTASYMTNELSDDERAELLPLLLRVTGKVLLLIEPGTKVGSEILRRTRDAALRDFDVHVAAPCPGDHPCPITDDDWCHFTERVSRSRLHKQLKGGDVPYEDEKFSYLALCKGDLSCHPANARILRHPQKDAGRITVTVCKADGISVETVTKKDKERFTRARKASAGDIL